MYVVSAHGRVQVSPVGNPSGSVPESVDGRCEGPEPSGYRCGDYDVAVYSGGYTSESHYFDHASGDLVAVRYTTDTNTCCGGFSY